jgi:hypothetical protein
MVDNAKQFDCDLFKYFCYPMGIEVAFASVYHPLPPVKWGGETSKCIDIHSDQEVTR